jgi:hypothetical protein
MGTLPHPEILKLHEHAISANLVDSRPAMLAGIAPSFVASLPLGATPSDQILRDLNTFNDAGALVDGTVPLVTWLTNAAQLAGLRVESAAFRSAIEQYQAHAGPNIGAGEALMEASIGDEAEAAQHSLRKSERLLSNLLVITSFGPTLWLADSQFVKPEDVKDALLKATPTPPHEWVLYEKRLYSLRNLGDECWRSACVTSTIRATDASVWSATADKDRRAIVLHLLRRTLEARLWPDVRYRDDVRCYAFAPSTDLSPRVISYGGASRRSAVTVFKGYSTKGRTTYYRHLGFSSHFRSFDGQWYLEISPTYVFTSDGKSLYRYHQDRLQDIKRYDRNRAVLSQVLLLADYLRGHDDLFTKKYPYLLFGSLLEFNTEVGIDESMWMRRESASDASLLKQSEFSFIDP